MRKSIPTALIAVLAFILCAFFVGSPEELDKGIGILQVEKKLTELKPFLVEADSAKLINRDKLRIGMNVTSAWTVNLKKAKMTDFFGLKITSIEVYCHGDEDDAGKTINERVESFVIYTERPRDSVASESFRLKLWDKYGEPQSRMFSPDYTEVVYDSWFNDNDRMLDMIYGIDVATGKKFNYYEADFR